MFDINSHVRVSDIRDGTSNTFSPMGRFIGELQRALRLGECLLSQSIARIEWVTSADVHSAWDLFHTHRDKG